MLHRHEVVQRVLDRYERPDYLEIGVSFGVTFNALRAARKVAVDPDFQLDIVAAAALPLNEQATFHPMTSDAYFALHWVADQFDVVFLDGLHTFDQTLRDLLAALACLRSGGVIVIDDVVPSSYAASLPDMHKMLQLREAYQLDEPSWMGDVYRLVFFIRDYLPHLSYATVAENHGQTIVWRRHRAGNEPALPVRAIAELSYCDAMLDRTAFNFNSLDAIVKMIDAECVAP